MRRTRIYKSIRRERRIRRKRDWSMKGIRVRQGCGVEPDFIYFTVIVTATLRR